MANIICKSWYGVKVEIKKEYYWNCCLKPSQGFGPQIEPQPTSWQYLLINYPDQNLELDTAIEEILQIAELRIRDIVIDNYGDQLTKLTSAVEPKFTEIVLGPKHYRSLI